MQLPTRLAFFVAYFATAPLAAQQLPPIRPLGPVTAVSPGGLLGSVSMVRPLPGGGVIVNDVSRRQLLVLDSHFRMERVIADTTPANGSSYGARMCGLLEFRGDSSLFIDPASLSMTVIDAHGVVVRTMAVPSVDDASLMIGGPFGTPGVDARGRIVYRGYGKFGGGQLAPAQRVEPVRPVATGDIAPVYRMSLTTRERETVGAIVIPMQRVSYARDATGQIVGTVLEVTPLPVVDEWVMMPDGRIAIVRGADYHVDWLDLDGHWKATPKIPYNWQRLDDEAKQHLLDSARVDFEKERQTLRKLIEASGRDPKAMQNAVQGSSVGPGVTITMTRGGSDGRPTMEARVPIVRLVNANELPSYRPAFRMGAARADTEGRLWVRTTAPSDAGPIYDVIDETGQLVDRVKLPYGRVISGFGPGVVYLGVLDDQGARLEMARIR